MVEKIPLHLSFDGNGDPSGLSEYQSGEVVGEEHLTTFDGVGTSGIVKGDGGAGTFLKSDGSWAVPADSDNQALWVKVKGDTGETTAPDELAELSIVGAGNVSTTVTPSTVTISHTAGESDLSELGDVTIGTPGDGEVLTYDSTSGKWQNEVLPAPVIGTGVITTTHILNGTILDEDIAAGTITGTKLDNNAVDTAQIAAGAVTTTEIEDGTIQGGDIAADTITNTNIATDAVTSSEIAADAVDTSEIAPNAITNSEIANATITGAKLVSDTITTTQLGTNSVDDDAIGPSVKLNSLGDTTISSETINDIITWNGASWVNNQPSPVTPTFTADIDAITIKEEDAGACSLALTESINTDSSVFSIVTQTPGTFDLIHLKELGTYKFDVALSVDTSVTGTGNISIIMGFLVRSDTIIAFTSPADIGRGNFNILMPLRNGTGDGSRVTGNHSFILTGVGGVNNESYFKFQGEIVNANPDTEIDIEASAFFISAINVTKII